MATYTILAVNFGSTSSKVAVYRNETQVFQENISHAAKDLEQFKSIWDQYSYRKAAVLELLAKHNIAPASIDLFASRGGNIRPVPGGIYVINSEMISDMKSGRYGIHACNVGCLVAYDLGQENKKITILIDPPVTDEMTPIAKMTGLPEIKRQGSFHALNQKATARKLAADLGKSYAEANLIICHLGGGISVGAHQNGLVIDVNNALDGDGPMAPERAGELPTGSLCDLCYSGEYSRAEIHRKLVGRGGWMAHLGTTDGREIIRRMKEGDLEAETVFKTTCYQVAKHIGAMAVVLKGKVDAIGLTGSLAHAPEVVEEIMAMTEFIATIHLYPGENEMEALAAGSLRFLRGEEEPKKY